jgi:hypothetical protein
MPFAGGNRNVASSQLEKVTISYTDIVSMPILKRFLMERRPLSLLETLPIRTDGSRPQTGPQAPG